MKVTRRVGSLFLIAAIALVTVLLGGCMTERTPIDQTPTLGLDKKLFEGEWFYKQTVTDIPYSVDYTFIGETNELKIIRWEITENWLYGWSIHDKINITDAYGTEAPARTPVLAFPILDHYDVKLAENSTTGEDLPMLVSNHDQPWWQRRYFMIDPSSNVVAPFDSKYMKLFFQLDQPASVSPISGYRNLEFHDGTGKAIDPRDYEYRYASGGDYLADTMSFYSEYLMIPNVNNVNWRYIESWNDVEEFINMEPARFELRHFLWRVNRDELNSNGFVTQEFQDPVFKRFGYFVRPYRGYDSRTGYRENVLHQYANYFNITGDHQIEYYLSPDYPDHLVLAACSIAADYNHAFSKAYYEGAMAEIAYNEYLEGKGEHQGFVSDFPPQIKMKDGLTEVYRDDWDEQVERQNVYMSQSGEEDEDLAELSSLFLPDAYTTWYLKEETDEEGEVTKVPYMPVYDPNKYTEEEWEALSTLEKMRNKNYYYLDYNIEGYQAPNAWAESNEEAFDKFNANKEAMVNSMLEYCFRDDPTDKYRFRRNELRPYDYDRDGVNPEGIPNLITPEEIFEIFGSDITTRPTRPFNYSGDYPVACKLTLDHRCAVDGDGRKVPRYKVETGDGRYSLLNWVKTPTEYGILGVAQWSDNPETGQIFGGVGNIAGAVLQWSVSRELERYFMIDGLKEAGFDPTREHYEKLLNDLIIDSEYNTQPMPGEETENPEHLAKMRTSTGSIQRVTAKPYDRQYEISALNKLNILSDEERYLDSDDLAMRAMEEYGSDAADRLRMFDEKHLPKKKIDFDLSFIKGTQFESLMTPNSLLTHIYPEATSYSEDMLYEVSAAYWGNYQDFKKAIDWETEWLEACYFQAEWLDSGFLEIIQKLDGAGYSRDEIFKVVERIMFKGVAQHEIGHSIGLRHNFMGSADELNYVGDQLVEVPGQSAQKTGYWAFKEKAQEALDQAVVNYADEKGKAVDEVTATEKFYIEKQIGTPRDWYMYSSVMDYMDEFYYHGFGLGKYDIAAILYAYGRGVEKYRTDSSGNVVYKTINYRMPNEQSFPVVEIQPLYEWRYCGDTNNMQNDIYSETCACIPGQPEAGFSDDDCITTEHEGMTFSYNQKKPVYALREQVKLKVEYDQNDRMYMVADNDERVSIQLNGDIKPYMYCPDNWRYEEPMCNVWDKGYSARDVVRNMVDQYKRFYFWRFFRRGNPKFKPISFWYSVSRFLPFVHFALDYNYNRTRVESWWPVIVNRSTEPYPRDEENNVVSVPQARLEYLQALNGVEEWNEVVTNKWGQPIDKDGKPIYGEDGIAVDSTYGMPLYNEEGEPIDLNGNVIANLREQPREETTVRRQLTPNGPGDFLIASMEGFNFLVYDVMYSPDVAPHTMDNWIEDQDHKFFLENEFVVDVYDQDALDIDLRYGHYHRNHWDRQDDLSITQARMIRRGFTEEKDAAAFVLAFSGFPSSKYEYESMANAYHYVSDGFDNAIFHLMSDVVNEDALYTFSRYCARIEEGQYKMDVYQPRVNELFLWNWTEDWAQAKFDEVDSTVGIPDPLKEEMKKDLAKIYPRKSDFTRNMCEKLSEQKGETWYPVHGSWIYFDKFWPGLFTMFFQNNFLADNTAYEYYTTIVIPVSDRKNWAPPGPDEVECLSSKQHYFYRAIRLADDIRPSPIYNLVQRCHDIQQMCVIDPDDYDREQWGVVPGGQVPGNMRMDGCVAPGTNLQYPRWYINMYLEHMESTFQILNSFAKMWNDF